MPIAFGCKDQAFASLRCCACLYPKHALIDSQQFIGAVPFIGVVSAGRGQGVRFGLDNLLKERETHRILRQASEVVGGGIVEAEDWSALIVGRLQTVWIVIVR